MTRVTVRFGRDGSSIEAVGHAGTKESCAAVSALLGALAGWAENNAGSHRLETGRARIAVPRSAAADAAAELTVIGLLQVQKAAPGDLKVELRCEEETDCRPTRAQTALTGGIKPRADCRHGGHETPRRKEDKCSEPTDC